MRFRPRLRKEFWEGDDIGLAIIHERACEFFSLQEFWEGDDIGLAIIHERACEFFSSRASVEVRGAKSSVKSQGTGPGNNWTYGKGVFHSLKPNVEVVTHAQTTSTKSKTGSSDSGRVSAAQRGARNASGNHPSAPVDGPCAWCTKIALAVVQAPPSIPTMSKLGAWQSICGFFVDDAVGCQSSR
ncbi:hypothetical protein B0H14DRAFT_3612120 [Mycena olivaceomarginata]|nr:hypothetical protein B0H14DRAFT_3612120 [Mycena olivaceomarginata]